MQDSPTPLIYNPRSAGGAGARIAARAQAALARHGIPTGLHATQGPGGARPLAARLAAAGHSPILVLGGDGTLSEAADGVLGTSKRPPLGFLPGGTGNSFLMDFGVRTVEEAAQRIANGNTRAIDVGRVHHAHGERHFINVFGVGFAAHVCDFANRRLKRLGSHGYTLAVFPELARLKAPMTRMVLDGHEINEPIVLAAACNSVHTGGAMKMAPQAKVDDGLLDVVALRKVGRAKLLQIFPRIFNGSHVGIPEVIYAQAREVRFEPETPGPLLGDGEVYGRTPVDIRVLPGALDVFL